MHVLIVAGIVQATLRRRSKVDDNQSEIVQALRNMGCSVECLHAVGSGVPDLLVGLNGINLLLEVKDGSKPPSARKLTIDQVIWHDEWRGQVQIVKSVEHAIRIVNHYRKFLQPIAEEVQ